MAQGLGSTWSQAFPLTHGTGISWWKQFLPTLLRSPLAPPSCWLQLQRTALASQGNLKSKQHLTCECPESHLAPWIKDHLTNSLQNTSDVLLEDSDFIHLDSTADSYADGMKEERTSEKPGDTLNVEFRKFKGGLLVVQIGLWVFDYVASSSSNRQGGFIQGLFQGRVQDVPHDLPGDERALHLDQTQAETDGQQPRSPRHGSLV